MFETAISDRSDELRLQEKVLEAARVNSSIAAFGSLASGGSRGSGAILLVSFGGGGDCGWLKFLVRIVDEIFFVGHGDGFRWLLMK